MIHEKGTAYAALLVVGIEHEVVENQLLATGEEVDEALFSIQGVELEARWAVYLYHGKITARGADVGEHAGSGFLLFEKLGACLVPF